MLIGADYYPEHWPKDRWPADARLMHRAGIRVVRMGEFAWHRFEPQEGRYDFTWLDEVMKLQAKYGIRAILGTPSATPTAWQVAKWPDLLPVKADGTTFPFGVRRHYCPRHEGYLDACRRMADAMARHWGRSRQVIGWQIDNEFGALDGGGACFCPRCVQAWRQWLRRRYRTLKALNDAWGTPFWAQQYTEWDQVVAPVQPVTSQNPSLHLDWRRFSSEAFVEFQQVQVDALRPHLKDQFITTNLMGTYEELDYEALARPLDVAAWDNYPIWAPQAVDPAMGHAVTRGLKQRNFYVFEQQSGPSGWNSMTAAPRPGQIRMWTWQSFGHGADAVIYFRWRACRFGTEQYWHGILQHDGATGRRYKEVQQVAREAARLSKTLDGSEVRPQAAIWHTYDANWVIRFQPGWDGMTFWDEAKRFGRALARRGVAYDVVTPSADLRRYRLIVCPHAVILRPEHAAALRDFARAGGTVVFTARSGERTWNNQVTELPRPGLLRGMAGCRIVEYDMVPQDKPGQLEMADTGRLYDAFGWCDLVEPAGAAVVARYAAEFYKGTPAVTVNRVGKGRVYYVGASAEDAFYDDLLARLAGETKIPMLPPLPPNVEVLERRGKSGRFLILVNYTGDTQTADVAARGKDLLGRRTLGPKIELEPYGVRVMKV
jgi:beta-galactosidase